MGSEPHIAPDIIEHFKIRKMGRLYRFLVRLAPKMFSFRESRQDPWVYMKKCGLIPRVISNDYNDSATFTPRRDSTENWNSFNPVISLGEFTVDTTVQKVKIGDGVNRWNDLPYVYNIITDMNNMITRLDFIKGGL
jgi:hypothetical protein